MFKITSLENPLVKHLVKLRTDPHYRREQGSLLITGVKLVEELQNYVKPKRIFTHQTLSESVMKRITGLTHPDGAAAEFPLPSPSSLEGLAPLLAFDRVSDPGNMGTLIRTALALGWGGVFFLPGSVDPFHEKVLRASRGALFHLPWREGSWEELKEFPLTRYTADIKGRPLDEIPPQKEIVFLLSNEGQGVSAEGAQFGEAITIPMKGEAESLNVSIAGAIMMYHLARQG